MTYRRQILTSKVGLREWVNEIQVIVQELKIYRVLCMIFCLLYDIVFCISGVVSCYSSVKASNTQMFCPRSLLKIQYFEVHSWPRGTGSASDSQGPNFRLELSGTTLQFNTAYHNPITTSSQCTNIMQHTTTSPQRCKSVVC